jgi:hypothetical protein
LHLLPCWCIFGVSVFGDVRFVCCRTVFFHVGGGCVFRVHTMLSRSVFGARCWDLFKLRAWNVCAVNRRYELHYLYRGYLCCVDGLDKLHGLCCWFILDGIRGIAVYELRRMRARAVRRGCRLYRLH